MPAVGRVALSQFCYSTSFNSRLLIYNSLALRSSLLSIVGLRGDSWIQPSFRNENLEQAKRRLVDFCFKNPELSQEQIQVVKRFARGDHQAKQCLTQLFGHFGSIIQEDLSKMLEDDVWKGQASGQVWIGNWLKWADPFNNLNALEDPNDPSLGKTLVTRVGGTNRCAFM